MYHILIVEDNTDINQMLADTLSDAGHQITSAYNGLNAVTEVERNHYDLVLLDIMLPYKSGDEVLREIRSFSMIPVIIISAKDMVGTKIDLLKLGADDYITKPFDLGEVAARIASLLRRSKDPAAARPLLQYKDLTLDLAAKRVSINEAELELTAKEYQILELFMKNPGKVFTKANLYESIWQAEYLGDDNAVKTHISNFRSKLKKHNPKEEYIETVWGLGYRLYQE